MWPFTKKKQCVSGSEYLIQKSIEYRGHWIEIRVKDVTHLHCAHAIMIYWKCVDSDSHINTDYEKINETIEACIRNSKRHIDFIIDHPKIISDLKEKLQAL